MGYEVEAKHRRELTRSKKEHRHDSDEEEEDEFCCFSQNVVTQLFICAFVLFFLAICGGIAATALGAQRCCGSAWSNKDYVSLACSTMYRSCYDVTRGALGLGISAASLMFIGFLLLGMGCHCQHQKRQDKKQRKREDAKAEAKAEREAKEERLEREKEREKQQAGHVDFDMVGPATKAYTEYSYASVPPPVSPRIVQTIPPSRTVYTTTSAPPQYTYESPPYSGHYGPLSARSPRYVQTNSPRMVSSPRIVASQPPMHSTRSYEMRSYPPPGSTRVTKYHSRGPATYTYKETV